MTDEAVCTETQKIPSLPDGAYALKVVELTFINLIFIA